MDAGRVCEGPFQAKNQGKSFLMLLIYSLLIGGGAARLPEPRPLTEERVVRPPPLPKLMHHPLAKLRHMPCLNFGSRTVARGTRSTRSGGTVSVALEVVRLKGSRPP